MRKLMIAMSFAVLSIAPAFAADDSVMAGRFGNTTMVNSSVGDAKMYFTPDHAFTGKATALFMHLSLKGTWRVEGGNLCLTYVSPPPGESNPDCSPVQARSVGDTWDADGRKVTLVKGIQ